MAAKADSVAPNYDTAHQQLAAQPHPSHPSLNASPAQSHDCIHGSHAQSGSETYPDQLSQSDSLAVQDKDDRVHDHSSAAYGSCTQAKPGSSAVTAVPVGSEANDQTEASSGKGAGVGSRGTGQADTQRMEQEYVHDVYNAIAPHFSSTRFAIWPKVIPKEMQAQQASTRKWQSVMHTV